MDKDFIKGLFNGWEPEIIEDTEPIDFKKPIKGKYVCEIRELKYFSKTKDDGTLIENYGLKLQVVDEVDGEKAHNRFLNKTYWLGTSEYNSDPDKGYKDILTDLNTCGALAGVNTASSPTKQKFVDRISSQIIGKKVNVSAYIYKEKQVIRVVNKFKVVISKSTPVIEESKLEF